MELRQLNLNMIIMIKKSFLFVFVFMLSCSSNNSKQEISIDDRSKIISIQEDKLRKEIKENSGILIPNYTLIESNTEEAMGDYAENYVLKFDAEDFKKIISQIEKSSYYTNIVNPNTALKEGKLKSQMLGLNKVIDGQIILLLLNGITIAKYSMLTTQKSSLARKVYCEQV